MSKENDGLTFRPSPSSGLAAGTPIMQARPVSAVLHEWQEEERLVRFFGKLLGEVTFLNADVVEFRLDGDSVRGAIVKDGRELKSLSVKPLWLPLMKTWLSRRENPTFRLGGKCVPQGIPCSVRLGDHFVSFLLTSDSKHQKLQQMSLSGFVDQSVDQFYDQLLGDSQGRIFLERVFLSEQGTLLVASPPGDDFARRLGLVLIASGAGYLGDVGDAGTREVLHHVASQQRVVVSVSAEDPIEGVMLLRSYGLNATDIGLRGCLATGCVKAVCRHCARTATPDSKMRSLVPEHLQLLSLEKYVVGRGCEGCGHQGYDGFVAVFSVLPATPMLLQAEHTQSQIEIVRHHAHQGLRPLFEEAYRKALQGVTTLEAIVKSIKLPSQLYIEFWKDRTKSHSVVEQKTSNKAESNPLGSTPLFPVAQTVAKTSRQKPVVLVVEDDDDQRAILELVLKGADYEVQQARNGEEALKSVAAVAPDIIVSDLMMPVMDGSQMVNSLKHDAKTSQIPVLMLTVIDDAEREYALLDLGADDYCNKTIQRKVLLKRVENLLKRTIAR